MEKEATKELLSTHYFKLLFKLFVMLNFIPDSSGRIKTSFIYEAFIEVTKKERTEKEG